MMRKLCNFDRAYHFFFPLSLSLSQEEIQNLSTTTGEKGDDLIRVLRELTTVQRKIADLQVELQGRKVSYPSFIM
jgi:hypothetical protein